MAAKIDKLGEKEYHLPPIIGDILLSPFYLVGWVYYWLADHWPEILGAVIGISLAIAFPLPSLILFVAILAVWLLAEILPGRSD